MKLAHARMTHIPSSMMKMTIDSVEISSISIVTYHCQKTSPPRMKLAHARMTHIPSSLYSNPPYTLHRNPSNTIIVTHHTHPIVTHHTRSTVTNFRLNTSPLRWSFGGNKWFLLIIFNFDGLPNQCSQEKSRESNLRAFFKNKNLNFARLRPSLRPSNARIFVKKMPVFRPSFFKYGFVWRICHTGVVS